LLPLQQQDFEGLFEEMQGLPVTIRLLDPPLHEFLPSLEEIAQDVERARIERSADLEELERTLDRVHALQETNPMLGTRGCRVGILHPEIYEMQVEAIVRAALAVKARTGEAPHLEIMIPLVAYEQELEARRALVRRTGCRSPGSRPRRPSSPSLERNDRGSAGRLIQAEVISREARRFPPLRVLQSTLCASIPQCHASTSGSSPGRPSSSRRAPPAP